MLKMDWDSRSELSSKPFRHKRRCNERWKRKDKRHCALYNNSVLPSELGSGGKSIAGAGDSVKKASDSLFSTEEALRQLISTVTDATTDLNDRQIQTIGSLSKEIYKLPKHVLKQERIWRMKTTPFGFPIQAWQRDL